MKVLDLIGKTLKLTFIADLAGSLAMLIIFFLAENFGLGVYVGILTFGFTLLPTLGGVVFYLLIKQKTTLDSRLATQVFQAFLLSLFAFAGLFLWAGIDVYLYANLGSENILEDFTSQFAGFLPAAFTQALLLPILDSCLHGDQKIKKQVK